MRLRLVPLLIGLAAAATGCISRQPAPGPAVAVLVDLSGSARPAQERYLADFRRVLDALQGTERLYAFGITANSGVSPLAFDMAFQVSNGNAYTRKVQLKRTTGEAAVRFGEFLEATRLDGSGTAIIDALRHAADVLAKLPPEQEKVLVVLSDMIEQSELHDFTGLAAAEAHELAGQHQKQGKVPDLKGVRVYVAGITDGNGALPSSRVQAIRGFWEKFFEAAGARLEWYGPSLVDFRLDAR